MVVMERRPELEVSSWSKAELRVERREIRFQDLDQDTVRIELTVYNDGGHRSPPTLIRIESAPFGAFVPWKPLARLVVPAIGPGESREVSFEASRPHPVPLGDFNGVPPRRLLTALSSADQPAPANPGLAAWLELLRRGRARSSPNAQVAGNAFLAPDIWDWLGRGQTHWAGNINVFVGQEPVERHMAKALRIYAGRTNMAMFVVGSPRHRDAFAFELVGLAPDWKACLFDVTNAQTLVVGHSDEPISEGRWVEANGPMMIMLATQPPADCSAGNLQVQVLQRSTQKEAIVEFDLDPKAQGPGCYML